MLFNEFSNFLAGYISLIKVPLEVQERVLQIKNLLIVLQIAVVHQSINHVVVRFLKDTVVLDEMQELV